MVVSEIKLYELLKAKIGEREAEAFIEILENDAKSKSLEKSSVVATQEDISKMINNLLIKISEVKADIIKWRIATAIAIVGLIAAFLKFI